MTAKWEIAEGYLFQQAALGQWFNSIAMADDLGITGPEASELIQCYLAEQRRPWGSRTQFVLTREGRTSAAMWHVGVKAADAHDWSQQTIDDLRHRVTNMRQDLIRMGHLNPQAQARVNAIIGAFEFNLGALAAALP